MVEFPISVYLFAIFSSGLSIAILTHILLIQIKQFKVISNLQPLKYLMTGLIVSLILANMLVLVISSWYIGSPIPKEVIATSSVANRFIAIFTTVLLWLIYRFNIKDKGLRRRKTDK